MTIFDLVFCDYYGYPPQIKGQLRRILEVLSSASSTSSILLLGSAARGELSYAYFHDRLEVFSDYEFLVITDGPVSVREKGRQTQMLVELEEKFFPHNPLFHIDVIYREKGRLSTLQPIIFTYELKQNAQALYGSDVKASIPDVSLRNLDLKNANEILYKRLWAMLLHIPRNLVKGAMSDFEEMVLRYVLWRNPLDLTTVLLPHEGVLLPTYEERVAYVAKNYRGLRFSRALGPEFPSFLAECLAGRKELKSIRPSLELYSQALHYLEKGLAYIVGDFAQSVDLPVQVAQRSRRIFNEGPISRGELASLARLGWRLVGRRGLKQTWRWLRMPKKGLLTAGFLHMHRALLDYLKGKIEAAGEHLDGAEVCLNELALKTAGAVPPQPFPGRWLALRRLWGEFWAEYIRLGDPRYKSRFQFIMEWRDE